MKVGIMRRKYFSLALPAAMAALALVASPALGASNSWAATSNMNSVRAGHSATILVDGRSWLPAAVTTRAPRSTIPRARPGP
jgi:hypothetical protein